jgi:ribosome-binding factor A
MADFRTERLGQTIQGIIGSLILEGKIKDSRVSPFLSITRVDVSKDLSFADAYVSDVRGGNSGKGAQGLQNAAGFIQSQMGSAMRIRKIPRLRFHADSSIAEGFEIIKKIEELNYSDNGSRSGADDTEKANF